MAPSIFTVIERMWFAYFEKIPRIISLLTPFSGITVNSPIRKPCFLRSISYRLVKMVFSKYLLLLWTVERGALCFFDISVEERKASFSSSSIIFASRDPKTNLCRCVLLLFVLLPLFCCCCCFIFNPNGLPNTAARNHHLNDVLLRSSSGTTTLCASKRIIVYWSAFPFYRAWSIIDTIVVLLGSSPYKK